MYIPKFQKGSSQCLSNRLARIYVHIYIKMQELFAVNAFNFAPSKMKCDGRAGAALVNYKEDRYCFCTWQMLNVKVTRCKNHQAGNQPIGTEEIKLQHTASYWRSTLSANTMCLCTKNCKFKYFLCLCESTSKGFIKNYSVLIFQKNEILFCIAQVHTIVSQNICC
jgi:hypothetical protein